MFKIATHGFPLYLCPTSTDAAQRNMITDRGEAKPRVPIPEQAAHALHEEQFDYHYL